MSEREHIHLIGICGTAMASLAGLLKQRGYQVTGSDSAADIALARSAGASAYVRKDADSFDVIASVLAFCSEISA